MKRVELSNVVLDVIAQQQPISIRDLVSEISSRIGCKVSKHEVKELLEIDLRDQVAKSRDKLWTLRTSATLSLSTLAAYYLESLALERDTEIKLYATPFDEDRPNFLVLKGLPIGQNRESVWPKKTRDFIADARPRAKNVNLYIGYPVFVKKGRKDSSDLVFPLFLFSLRMDQSDESGYPSLDIDPPRINSEAFKHSGNSFGDIQEDLKGIRSALGLDADDEEDLPTIPELIDRLKAKYPAWPWREEIDIANLSRESLAEKSEGGFFNSAILFWGEGSKFVQGLESELTELRALKPEDYEESVLDQILDPPSGNIQADNEVAIYRHLPLNPAQAGAVNSAMVNPLTVITGPPGTGKSQVVGSIITNAALQGQSVLVSSRNHKAVDVVVDRVNGLAAQTFLHKLGSEGSGGDFSPLVSGITSRNSRREASNLDAIKRRSDELRRDLEAKREALDKGIQSRNHVDELSKDLQDDQPSRDSQLLNLGSKSLERKAAHCRSAFESLRNDQEKVAEAKSIIDLGAMSFFSRLLWGINKTSRLKRASDQLREIAGWHGIKALNEGTDAESLLRQCDFLMSKLAEKIEAARRWSDYYRELQNLEQFDLSACQSEYLSIEDKLATIDLEYWRAWLAELPRRLSPSDITIISDFAALTQLANAGDESEKRKIATRIKELTPRVTRILPAWAITSLSLRNRVPFEEGLFDLVVIDEASQCDIASALPLLFRAKRAVIIGDPQQLKHITSLLKATDTRLMTQFGILDHPTWGYSTNSLYDV
ncbi:MAG: AAA family ATPase, partial [Bdellovibrionales bacterium]|nr:AAA family ATPase [Bdellovibrionales bacterium]